MNDIDKIPVKCQDCPYCKLASYPWCCGDCKDIMNPKNGEYIKRIDAKQALTALSAVLDAETIQRCIEAINNLKAAMEPARHGRWIKVNGLVACSVCKENPPRTYHNFCPNCGAKMDAKPPKEEKDD